MKRRQAYKFEVMENGCQQRMMRRFTRACRFVFNKALPLQEQNHKNGGKYLRHPEVARHPIDWKKDVQTTWLKQSPSQALQQLLMNLNSVYRRFFDKLGNHPRFKKKGQGDSFRFPQGFKLDQPNHRIFLPKLGWLRYRNSRNVEGTLKNVTVSQSYGKSFISIQAECGVEQPVHPATSIIAIDLGIAKFATLSNGEAIEPQNIFKKQQICLARYQRAMSTKPKFSKNWIKAKARVRKIHSTIANVRRDSLHKTSTAISKNHALVCIEDLKVTNLSKSAAGTKESPSKNVKAKSGLNQSILDQGWAEFRRQLEYKQDWQGGMVVAAVPPHHTSHVAAANRKTQAAFECVACGYASNADLKAAHNILAAGHAVLACGGRRQSDRPKNQESTDATAQEAALV